MTEQACLRCGQPVLLEDGHLVYCRHCGAPQIFLAEDLQAEIAEGARSYQEQLELAAQPRVEPPAEPGSGGRFGWGRRLWQISRAAHRPGPLAVRAALLIAAVAFTLGLLSLLLPSAGLLLVLWILAAPVLAVTFFHARLRSPEPPGPGFAARLGLLTGVLVVLCCLVIFALSLLLTRFVFHDAGLLDAQLSANFAQQRTVVLARLGPEAQPTLDLFATPEYRVGLLLAVLATSGAAYLLVASLTAAVVDAVLRRRRVMAG